MRAPRSKLVLVVVVALAAAIFGITRLVGALTAPAEASQLASLEGLTAQVTTAGWSKMDHDMSQSAPGYQMPPAMMPGMPEGGNERIAVTVAVTNTSTETKPLRAGDEFVLRTEKDGKRWTPHSHTFGELPRLAPHNAVSGTIFFDLLRTDIADSPVWLEWTHGGTTTRLTVPLDGATAPNHGHNP